MKEPFNLSAKNAFMNCSRSVNKQNAPYESFPVYLPKHNTQNFEYQSNLRAHTSYGQLKQSQAKFYNQNQSRNTVLEKAQISPVKELHVEKKYNKRKQFCMDINKHYTQLTMNRVSRSKQNQRIFREKVTQCRKRLKDRLCKVNSYNESKYLPTKKYQGFCLITEDRDDQEKQNRYHNQMKLWFEERNNSLQQLGNDFMNLVKYGITLEAFCDTDISRIMVGSQNGTFEKLSQKDQNIEQGSQIQSHELSQELFLKNSIKQENQPIQNVCSVQPLSEIQYNQKLDLLQKIFADTNKTYQRFCWEDTKDANNKNVPRIKRCLEND